MRILIYGLNYAPELTGVGKYTGEMASWLGSQGHDVRVVTGQPYYPDWTIPTHYGKLRYRIERADSYAEPRVYRCPLWVPLHPSGITRLIHLSSFAVSSLPAVAMQSFWKPEVVVAVQPTFFTAPAALLLAAVTGAKSWLHVQDFEVDAAFELKMLPGKIKKIAKSLEKVFTGAFSRVSTISDKMVDQMAARGVTRGNTFLFPNWIDVESVRPATPGSENRFRNDLSLSGKTVLLYSGTMGAKQGLEALATLAESCAHDLRVHFIFCGDGPCRSNLKRLVAQCRNVTMLPLQSRDLLNDLLNAADIHLLPQDPGVRDLVMPSKLSGMLSSGKPIVAMAYKGTQLSDVVEGRGLVVPPSDAAALHDAALRLVDDPDLRAHFGEAARAYAVENLSKEDVLRRFEKDLIALVSSRWSPEEVQLAQGYRS